jgi:hypothetical protein
MGSWVQEQRDHFEAIWTLEWDPPIYFKHMFFGMFILTSTPNYIPLKDKETLVQFMSMWMSQFATPLNYRCLIKTSNRIVPAYHIHKQRCTMDEEELWKLSCGWKVFAQIRRQFQTKIHPYSSSYIPQEFPSYIGVSSPWNITFRMLEFNVDACNLVANLAQKNKMLGSTSRLLLACVVMRRQRPN